MKFQILNIVQSLFLVFLFNFNSIGQNFGLRDFNTGRIVAIENYGEPNQIYLREADINYQSFDLEETYFSFENAVAQNPNSANTLLRRAAFKQKIGMKTEAAEDFRRANRLNPYAADLYGYNGTYSLLNILAYEPEEALTELSWTTKMKDYHAWFHQYFLDEEVGFDELDLIDEVLYEAEDENIETAKFLLDSLLTSFPNSAVAYDLKGLFLNEEGKYNAATEAFSKAVTLNPQLSIAWYNFAQVERIKGNYELAKDYLDRAIYLQPDLTKVYFARALVLKSMGQKEEALKDYNKIVVDKKEPIPEVYLNRGLTRKMLGDFGGALADLNAALEDAPYDPILYKNRGNLYLLLGYHFQAVEDYTKAIEFNEDFAEAYYNRALAHLIIFNNTSACFDLEKSADLGYVRADEIWKYFCVE